jgi:hypothetical protein
MIFSAIGFGYIVYGNKQRRGVALVCGVALCAFPYFLSNAIAVVATGIALMVVPFYLRY